MKPKTLIALVLSALGIRAVSAATAENASNRSC